MQREHAIKFCREKLNEHGLNDWKIRFTTNNRILGLCDYGSKSIILNQHHVEIHDEGSIQNTILHEIAHALCPSHGHDEVWAEKARAVGCLNTMQCSNLNIPDYLVDALRSGDTVDVEYVEEIIHKPKFTVTRHQEKCPFCHKVAVEVSSRIVEDKRDDQPNLKFIVLECKHTIIKKIPKGTPFHMLVSNGWREEIKSCKHEWKLNKCLNCGEFRLFPFQVDGAQFLESALSTSQGGAIFDEMGLGKTVQATAYLKYHPEMFPLLCVVKSSIKFNWFKEFFRWLGPEYLAQILEKSSDIPIPGFKIYIASYDLFVNKDREVRGKLVKQGFNIEKLNAVGIKTILADEVQQIKNPDAARTQMLRRVCKGKNFIALSGTPWKNRGGEYYTVLNLLSPMKFPSQAKFIDRWVHIYYQGKATRQGGIVDPVAFRDYIKDIAIRREIKDVMKEMPDVNRTKIYTQLTDFQQNELDEATEEFVDWYQDKVMGGEEDSIGGTSILGKLARMRHLIGVAKIPITEAYVEDFLNESGRTKIAVFTHHIYVQDTLVANFKEKWEKEGYKIIKFSGSMGAAERWEAEQEFNKHDKVIGVLSTLACGEGMNLPTCADAIMHEREWNPANEEQAAPGRFRRITSEFKIVNVIYNLAAGSVDEILDGINSRKELAFHQTMNLGEVSVWNQQSLGQEIAQGIIKNWSKKNRPKIVKKELVG